MVEGYLSEPCRCLFAQISKNDATKRNNNSHRVQKASAKNFVSVNDDELRELLMNFGIAKDLYLKLLGYY